MTKAIFQLSELNGTNGFILEGINENDILGFSVSGAGDVNGDGIDDLIVSALEDKNESEDENADQNNNNAGPGETYVVFGSNDRFPTRLNLSTLNGTNGFAIRGIDAQDQAGHSISNAGDLNKDGIDDIIIGARFADPNGVENAGESYVVFGSDSGFNSSFNLANLNGTNGFVIEGIDLKDNSGFAVSNGGDVNGDEIDDIIISARVADPNGVINAGETYVVFGSDSGFNGSLNLANLDGTNGFVIEGIERRDDSGSSVSSAGDLNKDGIDDLIIGARYADPNGIENAGESYVVFGSDSGFDAKLNLANLDGNNGFVIQGIHQGDFSGYSVSNAGDVNKDGIDDIIIGARLADPNEIENAGETYVVFGSDSGFNSSFNLADLDGTNGFTIKGINNNDQSGYSVSSAGDVNDDGIDDIIIGARLDDPNSNINTGETYVVFGSSRGFDSSLNLADLDGTKGFAIKSINNNDWSGFSVSGAGDINNDGIDDLIIGARDADPNGVTNAGESYIIFGDPDISTIVTRKLGDTNDDDILDRKDAIAISRVAVGLDSEFPQFPGVDPISIADMNGDGEISAFDAYLVI